MLPPSRPLTGIQLFAGGQPVTTFEITSDSETVYGPNGVQAVPKPLTILGAGIAAGFGAFFKRELNK